MRILVWDDVPRAVGEAVAALRSWGHEVVVAERVVEASGFDLVLVDLLMPEDSIAAIGRYREAGGAARVLLMVDYPGLEALDPSWGVDGMLLKPIRLDALRELLK